MSTLISSRCIWGGTELVPTDVDIMAMEDDISIELDCIEEAETVSQPESWVSIDLI